MQKKSCPDNRLAADLVFDQEDVKAAYEYLNKNPIELFKIPEVRALLTQHRLEGISEDQIKTLDEKETNVKGFTIKHNKDKLMGGAALYRPSLLINPLLSIDCVWRNVEKLKILSVGPRTEC